MNKEQNENKLIKLGYNIIFKKIQASFLLLAINEVELSSIYNTTILNYDKPNDLKEIENYISKNLFDLDKFLVLEQDHKLNHIEDIGAKKRNLEDIFISIKLYSFEIENIESLLRYYFVKLNAEKEAKELEFIKNVDNDALIKKCLKFIKTSDDKSNVLKGSVLSCFPLYLTKEKYSDFITENLIKEFDSNKEDFYKITRLLKQRFSPTKSPNYGKYFKEIEKNLIRISSMCKNDLDLDEINNITDEINIMKNEIDEINYYLQILLECFNYLIILLNYANNTDEFFINNNESKDLFYVVKENSISDDIEFYDDTIKPKLESYCESILDDVVKSENEFKKIIKNVKLKSSLSTELESINETINVFFYGGLEDCLYTLYRDDVVSLTLDEIIKDFKEYIKVSLSDLPAKNQKIIKQSFFVNVHCDYSESDIYEYIYTSLKNTNNYLENAVIIYELNELFDFYNFDTKNEHDFHHEHHVHDENCNHH